MRLTEFLRVPYLLQSSATEDADGRWLRRVEYPELPGCVATDPSLPVALDELDRRRVATIVGLLREGRRPALPRDPLPGGHPLDELERLGLTELVPIIELDERELAEGTG